MSGSKSSDGSFARAASRPPEAQDESPLGLTVHTLPSAEQAVASAQRTRHGRWKMLAVLAVCAAPVVASYFTYYVVRPEGRRNYGELIDPQRTLPERTAMTLDGAAVPLSTLKGQWLLVSVGGGDCDAACQKHLYLQRQLRESLGREKDRLDWVWLVNDTATPPAALDTALQKATVLRVDPADLAAWLAPAAGQALPDHLYVVDPMGNWMMRFPAAMDASGAAKAKRDLERLLRASSSWDEAGRPAKP
ncbi:SCO family protein [Paracidovorax sp. MALMAid1276]|uniref:SCO family protein n=1 Tax=Paracidovorax sp. MALMAid1276 TaxID=3411631 RepID=UPI003B9BBC34